ncbi:MAG TPA: hypothetical protein VLB27_10610, partial [candidate division Zixibacteria bacterium]|nr:hypothetical protein [candidate division Zixibacteria bacterium]
ESNPGKIGITLYFAGVDETETPDVQFACFLLLDSCIGEHDVVTKAGYVTRKILTGDMDPSSLIDLNCLGDEFDALYERISG